MACVPSEDSDQPGHPPSVIRVFAVRMKKAWALSYPLSTQRRLWSDWVDVQADLSLRWAHSHFVDFVVRRLILCERTVKALARLHGCAGSPEPSLFAYIWYLLFSHGPPQLNQQFFIDTAATTYGGKMFISLNGKQVQGLRFQNIFNRQWCKINLAQRV